MRSIVNTTIRLYLKTRYKKIEHSIQHPHITQADVLENLLFTASETDFGIRHGFRSIHNYQNFRRRVPICEYDDIKDDIKRMMHGERDLLWPGQVKWFAKSSGTTSDKSKFIPVTKQNLKHCHVKGFWDALSVLYHNRPDSKIFEYNNLVVGGSLFEFEPFPETTYGDVSAILINHMPLVGRPFYSPDFETAFMKKWDEKLERTAQLASRDPDIGSIGGVPTWNVVLFRRILEITGKSNLLEVWPNLQVYVHGGVNFEPYRSQFKQLIPKEDFVYQETYNASEGYFATQNDYATPDLLLFPDCGIFYEFIPMSSVEQDRSEAAIPLSQVEVGKNYALVITTNAGLWRYVLGDTVVFTSTNPYKLKITGRTKHFINAFGEEVMVGNTDKAMSLACEAMNVRIREYTVAPIYFDEEGSGGHEWVVEFEDVPADVAAFATYLDKRLQEVNSDYEAKRYKDMAMKPLVIRTVPHGTFNRWLAGKGKSGAQVKVPRLVNHRRTIEEILELTSDITPV